MSARLRSERAIQASAVISALCQLWPGTFAFQGRNRRPLSIGIHRAVLVAVEPAIMAGTITVKDIKRALAHYTRTDDYLRNMCAGAGRIDLAGNIVGAVTAAQAAHARQVLKIRKAARRANAGLASTKNGPPAAGTANGPISTKAISHDRSTPSSARASPAT